MNDRFFNESSVNIFTDGSIYKSNTTGETIGCAGAITVQPNGIQDIYDSQILRNSTNNHCEIYSIYLGIRSILVNDLHNKYKVINLFSDSKICILGLREWIFNWITKINSHGMMISSSGKEVANQELFSTIAQMIVQNNIFINLYHQKGHINVNKYKDVAIAISTFEVSNRIRIDNSIARNISKYNDLIDVYTGQILKQNNLDIKDDSIDRPFIIDMGKFDIDNYLKNITGGHNI